MIFLSFTKSPAKKFVSLFSIIWSIIFLSIFSSDAPVREL
jgi:hypothetical protein